MGIFDFQDSDNDNDGASDLAEIGGDPLAPLDLNGNGVDDYLEAGFLSGGDVDQNGSVDVADRLLLQRALTGHATLDATQVLHADQYPVGGDELLTIGDLSRLESLLIQ